jgi:hypothetical protein
VLGVSEDQEWFWDILFAASYSVIAGAMDSYSIVLSSFYVLTQKTELRNGFQLGRVFLSCYIIFMND